MSFDKDKASSAPIRCTETKRRFILFVDIAGNHWLYEVDADRNQISQIGSIDELPSESIKYMMEREKNRLFRNLSAGREA